MNYVDSTFYALSNLKFFTFKSSKNGLINFIIAGIILMITFWLFLKIFKILYLNYIFLLSKDAKEIYNSEKQ